MFLMKASREWKDRKCLEDFNANISPVGEMRHYFPGQEAMVGIFRLFSSGVFKAVIDCIDCNGTNGMASFCLFELLYRQYKYCTGSNRQLRKPDVNTSSMENEGAGRQIFGEHSYKMPKVNKWRAMFCGIGMLT